MAGAIIPSAPTTKHIPGSMDFLRTCRVVFPPLPNAEQMLVKMKEVANALEATASKCPCDGAFKGPITGQLQRF